MSNQIAGMPGQQITTILKNGDQQPRPSGPPPLPSFIITRGAQLLFLIGLLGSAVLAWEQQSILTFFNLSFIVTICYSGFMGWYNGLLRELAILTSLIAPPVIGYFSAKPLALYVGHTSWFAILGAFWVSILGSYLVLQVVMYLFRSLLWPASFPGRVCGLALGLGEAVLLFVAVGNIYQAVPFADQQLGQYMKPVMDYLGERFSTPGLQIVAASTREITDITLQIRKNGFDPNRVDQEALRRNFEPLANNPAIKELANDQVLMEKLKAGKSFEVLASPQIRALLADPALASAASQINWPEVFRSVRRGIPSTPLGASPPLAPPAPLPGEAPSPDH